MTQKTLQTVARMRRDDCPTDDFKKGKPNGQCWGDGHYRCKGCIYYRADFAKHGQSLIDAAHASPLIQISILNKIS